MKIIITGGAGFIGSRVADFYIENGNDVVIVDNLSSGSKKNINKKAKFYLADINSSSFDNIVKKEKPDIINHHAAQTSIPKSIDNPENDANVNIIGFLNLLRISIKYNIKKIIYISSGSVYNESNNYPSKESDPCNPLNPYSIAKYASERYLMFFCKNHNINYTILRYSNVYGPRQNILGESGVIPIFINKLIKNQSPVIYKFNNNMKGMIRDYIFVDDVARANILACEKGNNEIINISTNKGIKTYQIFQILCNTLKKEIKPVLEKPRLGDIKRSCLNNKKALSLLGWMPEVDIFEGIKKTCAYYI